MPLAVRDRLAASAGRWKTGPRRRRRATTVTLAARQCRSWMLSGIEKQTGNSVVDHRQQAAKARCERTRVTVDFKNEPYWSAIDKLLDRGESGRLQLCGRRCAGDRRTRAGRRAAASARRSTADRFGSKCSKFKSQRNLRKPNADSLKLQLEVAWEPRLRPIAVSQAAADLDGRRSTPGTSSK